MRKNWIMFKTEFKLSLRSPDAIIFTMFMPVIIVLIVGFIYKPSGTSIHETGLVQENLGAFLCIGIAAIGLMGLPLVLTDYRSKKVLKRLQVTPAHPAQLLGVQFAVQTLMALFSAFLVSITAILFFQVTFKATILALFAAYFLVLFSTFSIGLLIASVAKDVRQAGILCSIVYFPLLLLSGTTIPVHLFPESLQRFISVFPFRQGVLLLNAVINGQETIFFSIPSILLGLTGIMATAASIYFFRWDMDAVR